MAKYTLLCNIVLISMVALYCEATVVRIANFNAPFALLDEYVRNENKEQPNWEDHVMDFVKLVNMEKVLSTAVRFIDDPEVMRFIGFLLSPKFKDMVWELETMEEFKETYIFLATKGYYLQPVIDYVNTGLSLPHFEKPPMMLRSNAGVSGFLAAMVGTLPMEDIREVLKYKEQNYSEVKDFMDIIRSPEFTDIIKRMFKTDKFTEFKTTFESYGVDFSFICEIFEEIAGDDYENFICENNKEIVFIS